MSRPANPGAAVTDDGRASGPAGSPAVQLGDILLGALRALADAGEAEEACRLAGHACAAWRSRDAAQWKRFNVLLHRLGPRTGPVGLRGTGEPAGRPEPLGSP